MSIRLSDHNLEAKGSQLNKCKNQIDLQFIFTEISNAYSFDFQKYYPISNNNTTELRDNEYLQQRSV